MKNVSISALLFGLITRPVSTVARLVRGERPIKLTFTQESYEALERLALIYGSKEEALNRAILTAEVRLCPSLQSC